MSSEQAVDKMKGAFIADLDAAIDGTPTFQAVLKERELRSTNGRYRVAITLADRSGEIPGVIWDGEDTPAQALASVLRLGDVVKVRGALGYYNGKPQLTVEKIRRCADEEFDLRDFMQASRFDPEEMFSDLLHLVNESVSCPYDALLEYILLNQDIRDGLMKAPAAMKIHHCFVGGLLEHTLSMGRAAVKLCDHYERLDRSLLLAGCILHDIGKIEELKHCGCAIEYTASGTLVGHIVFGIEILNRFAGPDFPADAKMQLQHLIVSHHGEPEWGALKAPMTPEAIALHLIDQMDARLECAWRAIDKAAEEGEQFTPLEHGRRYYAGNRGTGDGTEQRNEGGESADS